MNVNHGDIVVSAPNALHKCSTTKNGAEVALGATSFLALSLAYAGFNLFTKASQDLSDSKGRWFWHKPPVTSFGPVVVDSKQGVDIGVITLVTSSLAFIGLITLLFIKLFGSTPRKSTLEVR